MMDDITILIFFSVINQGRAGRMSFYRVIAYTQRLAGHLPMSMPKLYYTFKAYMFSKLVIVRHLTAYFETRRQNNVFFKRVFPSF